MSNKTLKFSSDLVAIVLSGEKTSTWRLWDDKNLAEDDIVDFLEQATLQKFATAKLNKVVSKQMKDLTSQDKAGHEKFENDTQMYETYSKYYKKKVGPDTNVKIIWFDIIKKL